MQTTYVEYAVSFGVQEFEGLWKIQYLHPFDANKKLEAWVPFREKTDLIGKEVDGIQVATPGPRLLQVMEWCYGRINRYPYYWPQEGRPIDKFGYDFEVKLSEEKTSDIELTEVAFEILEGELGQQPPSIGDNPEVDIETDVLRGGGVLVKLAIELDYAQPISELNLAPFTKYPMSIEALLYEEDTETYHPKKEIPLSDSQKRGRTQSIHLQFPVVTAKRLTLVIRQENPEKNSYISNDEALAKNKLWNQMAQSGLGAEDEQAGWNLHLAEVQKHQEELRAWKREFTEYKEQEAARMRDVEELVRITPVDSTYREEYLKAVTQYKTKMVELEDMEKQYEAAQEQYERDVTFYNKYLRG